MAADLYDMGTTSFENTETRHGEDATAARAWWLLPLLLVFVLAGVVATGGLQTSPRQLGATTDEDTATWTPSDTVVGPSVSLEIDYGNGARRRFDALAWRAGVTVQDILEAASEFKPGIVYAYVGDGPMALLTEIDRLASGTNGGNHWGFWVNDVRADRSFAVYELSSNDEVLWKFAPQE